VFGGGNVRKRLVSLAQRGGKVLDFGFYLMDCLDGMREFPNNYFDLAIVDPPYGIGYDIKAMQSAGQKSKNGAAYKKEYHASNWDDKIPTKSYFDELFRVSKHQIIWGGELLYRVFTAV
jgi:site-specific DNA-methyltransferase (adenine-specific)